MKNILRITAVLFLFSQCSNKTTTTENTIAQIVTAEDYSKHLDSLGSSVKSSLDGLELFQKSFVKENPEENDKALRAYIEFQNKLIGSVEQELFDNGDLYEKLNTLFGEDSSLRDKDAVAYETELNRSGLQLSYAEGSVFLDSNPERFLEYFGPYLTESTKEFLEHYAIEQKETYSEDAGLIIPVQELSNRLIFWDTFLSKYPDHLFVDHAEDYYKTFLRTLLTGLDNTMAYDNTTLEWSKEFLEVYKSVIVNHPTTKSAQVLSRYLELLATSDFKYNDKVQEFIDETASFD
jgi:hypothetical protein